MNEKGFFDILLIVMFALAGITFLSLFFVSAPYGRYTRKGWGPVVNSKLAWVLQEAPSVFVFAIFFFLGEKSTIFVTLIFFLMWQIHYVQRTFIYPFLLRGKVKSSTLATVLLAFLFTSLNGYLNGRYLTHFANRYSLSWLKDPHFILGCIFFLTGFVINLHSDHILRNLRKPGEEGYKIPYGGLFRYISCPNYFGEILEWTGWAIATWSIPGLMFAVWTFANLGPRAISHHNWYKENFEDYPKQRRALIPGIL